MTTHARVVSGQVIVSVNLGTLAALADMSPRGRAAFLVEQFEATERFAGEFVDQEITGTSAPERPLSSLSASPTCSGCGTAVEQRGQRCASCTMKDEARAPQPRMALVNEGEPAYANAGNFRNPQKPSEESGT